MPGVAAGRSSPAIAAIGGAAFDDADLAQFEPVAAAVLRLDLSGTAISRMQALKTLTLIDTNARPERIAELRQRGVRVYDARE